MTRRTAFFLFALCSALAQTPSPQRTPEQAARDIRASYTKYEYRIPVRDGVKLFVSVYIPKDVFSDRKTYPILIVRTPYSVAPYGEDMYRANLGPSEFFEKEKFIFVYADVRGRYMSEGEHITIRPQSPTHNSPKEVDESTDAYDTIDWLVKHVPGNSGKVGIWGISQPGFYATAAMIDAHPALVAASPQAPVTDYYLGDDDYHNGAYMLAANFGFYMGFRPREGEPAKPQQSIRFDFGTPDGYEFYLKMGSLANADEKYFKHKNPYWTDHITHTLYDDYWASRSVWKYLKNIKPAVLLVGGWYDTEDPQGLIRQYDFLEANKPSPQQTLVLGPWNHGGFARGDGERLGNINFGSKTSLYYRENIEFPFFLYHLKGKGKGDFPKAWLFQTGVNEWRRFATWPPEEAKPAELFLDQDGGLAWRRPAAAAFDEYVSDPNKPVPYVSFVTQGMINTYMVEDQRFAASRPDVLVYKTEPLDQDVTIAGPITVDLKVSTTGTDSDFVVKLIDVYPGDYPDGNAPPTPATPGSVVPMGGYQQLVRGEPFRGKYRKGFEKGIPFEPGKPDRITFNLPDTAHTFRSGHRIMVQIQSSWFPLTDRNPQKFMDIPNAKPSDFVKATERVYRGGADGTRLQFRVAP